MKGSRVRGFNGSTVLAAAAVVVCVAVAAAAQTPAQPPPVTPPAAGQPQPSAPQPSEGYTYRPEGRRDPFVSLLNRGPEVRPTGGKGVEGLRNLTVGEIVLKGVFKSRNGTYLAMVQGPNGRTYPVRAKERLVDGVVKEINADSIVIIQDVNDPLSVSKQKEVRLTLREL